MYEFFDRTPWSSLRDCKKTTIAAINGICYAGGLITAALCDISVAAQSASFCIAEAKSVSPISRSRPSCSAG